MTYFDLHITNQAGTEYAIDFIEYDDYMKRTIIVIKRNGDDKSTSKEKEELLKKIHQDLFDKAMRVPENPDGYCFDGGEGG